MELSKINLIIQDLDASPYNGYYGDAISKISSGDVGDPILAAIASKHFPVAPIPVLEPVPMPVQPPPPAPENNPNYVYPKGKDIPDTDKQGWTESQLRDRNSSVAAEEIQNTGIYTDFRKINPTSITDDPNKVNLGPSN